MPGDFINHRDVRAKQFCTESGKWVEQSARGHRAAKEVDMLNKISMTVVAGRDT